MTLLLQGAPGSPYTCKMLAVLRYRRIAHCYITRPQADAAGLPRPKVELLPVLYFPTPDGYEAAIDSTPLIRRLEALHPARQILPPDPALAFLAAVIEDYADEWLTKAMFHYRWHFAPDRAQAGTILPLHLATTAPADIAQAMATEFTRRQVDRLRYVGSNPLTAPVIEASYTRLLGILEAIFAQQAFLFGERPSAADFALAGQLSQLAAFDPTPSAIALREAPRVRAWVDMAEDLSGIADDAAWSAPATILTLLRPLLVEIGRVYAPLLRANAEAAAAGAAELVTEIAGEAWRQAVFPYQVKCLAELRRLFALLPAETRATADEAMADTGLSTLFGPV